MVGVPLLPVLQQHHPRPQAPQGLDHAVAASGWWGRRPASGRPSDSRWAAPRMAAAASASAARISGVPRLPASPRVRSTRATLRPFAVSRARVPPMASSASSGWAQIAARSNPLTAPLLSACGFHGTKAPMKKALTLTVALLAAPAVTSADAVDDFLQEPHGAPPDSRPVPRHLSRRSARARGGLRPRQRRAGRAR